MIAHEKMKLTAAVLGTGYMGKQYIEILRQKIETLVICSQDVAVGKAIADQYGLRFYSDYEMLFAHEKLDAAFICLPTPLHYPATMHALAHGVHVLCEKPFAATVHQAREMTEAAKEKGLMLMVGHLLRFSGSYLYLKQCLEDQRFGKLMSLHLFRHNPLPNWSVGNWLADISQTGGMIKDLHIHDTDIVLWLLGMPKAVMATGSDAVCSVLYQYPEPVTVTASAGWRNIQEYFGERGYEAIFERGFISMKNGALDVKGPSLGIQVEAGTALENELMYFCRCVLNGEFPVRCAPEDSLKALILNDAESASLHQGKMITL